MSDIILDAFSAFRRNNRRCKCYKCRQETHGEGYVVPTRGGQNHTICGDCFVKLLCEWTEEGLKDENKEKKYNERYGD